MLAKTILIIEDNEEILDNTAEILGLAGYDVITANNGKEGFEKAKKHSPNVIICDIMMPVLDGYGVIHLLNRSPELQQIPFIFLSAKTERSDIRKGMELGADDYITKPFSETELLNAIESRLKKSAIARKPPVGNPLEAANLLYNEVKNNPEMKSLLEVAVSQEFKRKAIIYQEDKHPYYLYYIVKGKVKIFLTNEYGKELTVEMFGEGDFFGYTTLLEGGNYKESAAAMEDTELLLIVKKDFDLLINSNREIADGFIRMLAKNVKTKEKHLLGLAYNSLRKRVAESILYYKQKFGADKPRFVINISRNDLANIAGTATESLIRTLADFKEEKLVEIVKGDIIVLNEEKLIALTN